MEKGIKVVAIVAIAALLNKYVVRRFWPATTTTTSGA
jgi:heme A synthase